MYIYIYIYIYMYHIKHISNQTHTFIARGAGVRTSLAPRALNITRRSIDIDSGIVRIKSYPNKKISSVSVFSIINND
jgi:hypothetical protein